MAKRKRADDGIGTLTRLVDRVSGTIASSTWLARNAVDVSTFRAMRHGAESREDIVLQLRGVGPVGVRADTNDLAAVWELFHRGEYFSENPIRPITVVDLGANVGAFLAFIVARAGDIIEHYVGVEADRGSFAALQAQVVRMELRDRVALFNVAAWSETGQVHLADSGSVWGRSAIEAGGTLVDALSVTDILDEAAMPSCELLKMDIEGGEDHVLPTIDSWAHRVEVLTVELHGQTDEWLQDIVEAAGYRSLPRGAFFRHHPAAIREDVVGKWLTPGGEALLR